MWEVISIFRIYIIWVGVNWLEKIRVGRLNTTSVIIWKFVIIICKCTDVFPQVWLFQKKWWRSIRKRKNLFPDIQLYVFQCKINVCSFFAWKQIPHLHLPAYPHYLHVHLHLGKQSECFTRSARLLKIDAAYKHRLVLWIPFLVCHVGPLFHWYITIIAV